MLAEIASLHEQLSGPATRRLLERGHSVFGDERFQRLAGISVSPIDNLRASAAYRRIRVPVTRTQARQVAIGERRKTDPRGRPGYLRVDTVHRGRRGLSHIDAVERDRFAADFGHLGGGEARILAMAILPRLSYNRRYAIKSVTAGS